MDDELEMLLPEAADWREFLLTAKREGWRVPATEIGLFKGSLFNSALVLRCGGQFVGMVTAVNHGASAWIGNLIVAHSVRGRGFGRQLLDQAILRLEEQRARSIWLTASEAGLPLYRRRGFETVGQVERWVFPKDSVSQHFEAEQTSKGEDLWEADASVWGEKRPFLEYLMSEGELLQCGSNKALLQLEPGLNILGPWVADNAGEEECRQLLALAIGFVKTDEELVIDVRAGALAPQLLKDAGFALQGQTQLMVRGDITGIDLEKLVAFASLGSMG